MRKLGIVCKWLWIGVYILFIALLGIMILLSVTGPQHNLLPWQMAVGTAAGTVAFLAFYLLWDRYVPLKITDSNALYCGLLAVYGISLYIVSCICRNAPESFEDYRQVWQAACELGRGESLSEAWYFSLHDNNVKPMLLLSVLIRMAGLLHIEDPFYFVLLINVLGVLGAAWSVGILAGSDRTECKKYRILVLILFVCLLPIWANTQGFYTDNMSFPLSALTLAEIKLAYGETAWKRRFLLFGTAGSLAAVAIMIKITVVIPMLAGMMVILFSGRAKTVLHEGIGLFVIWMVLIYGILNWWAGSYEITEAAKENGEPVISWIARGMKGSGNWEDNQNFLNNMNTLPKKEDKVAYARTYIRENLSDFTDVEHLVQKVRCNFASGNLGTKDFTYYALQDDNMLWNLFSPWGKYYWRTSQICFCYLFSVYTLYFIGAAFTIVSVFQRKKISMITKTADLSLLGIILFLMLCEANNRQLYNQMPIILLGGILHVRQLAIGLFPETDCQCMMTDTARRC